MAFDECFFYMYVTSYERTSRQRYHISLGNKNEVLNLDPRGQPGSTVGEVGQMVDSRSLLPFLRTGFLLSCLISSLRESRHYTSSSKSTEGVFDQTTQYLGTIPPFEALLLA